MFLKEEEMPSEDRCTGSMPETTEAANRVMPAGTAPRAERGQEGSDQESQRERGPADAWILDFSVRPRDRIHVSLKPPRAGTL